MTPMTTKEIRNVLKSGDPEKIALLDPEDVEIFRENEAQRELWTLDGIRNLYMGICKDAVNVYKKAHFNYLFSERQNKKTNMEKELEHFFGEEFFLMVTGMRNREHTIKTIEETMIENRKQKLAKSMVKV